jgi:general secretion pathway protein I
MDRGPHSLPAMLALAGRTLRRRRAGFTLLEVMIAVVILAVGLSSLFTSEAGAVRIAQRARTTTIATLLARCKMGEIEERIAKEGWPAELIEDRDECCDEGEHDGFSCEWKVERIELPENEDDAESGDDEGSDDDEGGGSKSKGSPGVIDQLAELNAQKPEERMSAVTDLLSGDPDKALGSGRAKSKKDDDKDEDDEVSQSDMDPIAAMVMEMAFPIMRPVIEEGVRRASVNVKWKEGDREQNLEVVQFMVTEQQIILPEDEDDGGAPTTPGTTTPTPATSTPAGTTPTQPSTGRR